MSHFPAEAFSRLTATGPLALKLNEGLGLNREGSALLCYAWGESDRPIFSAARTLDDVRKFILNCWLGSDDATDYDGSNSLQNILAQLAAHDWRDDGSLVWEFEIGGVKITDAFEA